MVEMFSHHAFIAQISSGGVRCLLWCFIRYVSVWFLWSVYKIRGSWCGRLGVLIVLAVFKFQVGFEYHDILCLYDYMVCLILQGKNDRMFSIIFAWW